MIFFFFGCWPPPPSRRRSPLARSPPLLLVVCLKDDFFISLFLPHLPRRRANKAPQCLRAARPPPQQQKGKQKEATRESRGAKWGAKGQSFLASTWERDSAARLVAAPIETLSFHFHPSYLHGRRHVVPVELADLVTVRCQDGLAPRGVRLDSGRPEELVRFGRSAGSGVVGSDALCRRRSRCCRRCRCCRCCETHLCSEGTRRAKSS